MRWSTSRDQLKRTRWWWWRQWPRWCKQRSSWLFNRCCCDVDGGHAPIFGGHAPIFGGAPIHKQHERGEASAEPRQAARVHSRSVWLGRSAPGRMRRISRRLSLTLGVRVDGSCCWACVRLVACRGSRPLLACLLPCFLRKSFRVTAALISEELGKFRVRSAGSLGLGAACTLGPSHLVSPPDTRDLAHQLREVGEYGI